MTTVTPTQRPLMFAIAYRMTGSVTEAEDIVQDAYLRMLGHGEIANPDAYATTVTTRVAIDHLRSARVRRQLYVGAWLPEPLLVEDPAEQVALDATINTALLVLLERLSPAERAAFVLREAFGHPYERIAEILERTPAHCRQLVTRARAHVASGQRFEASADRQRELAERFLAACRGGDLAALEDLLAADVRFTGDGGGKGPAVRHPVSGRTQVARFILGLQRRADRDGIMLEPAMVNRQPGFQARTPDGLVFSVLTMQIADGQIQALFNVLNPDKLAHLQP